MPTPVRPRRSTVATAALAVAACLFDARGLAEAAPGSPRVLMQITPAGDFGPSDGRAMDVPAWRIDAAGASQVIARFNPQQPLVIDYEHQTLHAEKNGQPAPAAGWMHALRWIDGRGLFAEAELTPRARQQVADGEYRYFSPVIQYDPASGAVQRVLMGALTNNPAIHGMQAVDLTAAATARFNPTDLPETDVNLLEKLLAALGLPATTTEADALAACAARRAQAEAALSGLKLQADAAPAAVSAACAAQTRPAPATPDPAQYVPVAVVQELQTSLAALSASAHQRDAADVIEPALADGRLLPAEKDWAAGLAATPAGLASLKSLLAVRQPVAALTGTQTGGQPPQGEGKPGFSAEELKVAAACGLTPEVFATGRPPAAA